MNARVATTLEEVDVAIEDGGFCAVILDKEIPADSASAAYVATGDTALRRLRAYDPRKTEGDHHVLPILVFTSKADSDVFMSRNFVLGASFFLRKPATAEMVTTELLAALERGGLGDHARCAPPKAMEAADPRPTMLLVLDGVPVGRRISFLINGKRRDLQPSKFVTLLRLAAVRARGDARYLSSGELGITRAPEAPSRIREAVEGAVPEGFQLVQHGSDAMWRLHPLVAVAPIDWSIYERHAHPLIQTLAAAEKNQRG
jgi:hypothetical protein